MQDAPVRYGARPGPYMSGTAGPGYGQPVVYGKTRDLFVSALLVVVTLSIYHYVYHWIAHSELVRQLGRENNNVAPFIVYLLLIVFLGPVAFIPFIFIVINQYRAIADARTRLQLPVRSGAGFFLGWYIAGAVAVAFILLLMFFVLFMGIFEDARTFEDEIAPALMVMFGVAVVVWVGSLLAAYNHMLSNYNEIWRALAAGRRLPTDAEMGAAALPSIHGTPAYAPAAPTTYYGVPSSSWDAPARRIDVPAGPTGRFDVRARPQPATSPDGLVEQSFQCPRCHAHVGARGLRGAVVPIRCTKCGEAGSVTLPAA